MDCVRRASSEGVDAHELPAIDQVFCRTFQLGTEGHVIGVADNKAVGLVEVGPRFLPAIVVLAADARGVVEPQRSLRLLVDRLAKSVSAKKTQVVGETLFDLGLHRMVRGAAAGAPIGQIVAQERPRAAGIYVSIWVRGG